MFEWVFCYSVHNYKFFDAPSIAGGLLWSYKKHSPQNTVLLWAMLPGLTFVIVLPAAGIPVDTAPFLLSGAGFHSKLVKPDACAAGRTHPCGKCNSCFGKIPLAFDAFCTQLVNFGLYSIFRCHGNISYHLRYFNFTTFTGLCQFAEIDVG